jgi:DNA-directed RNA polymerase subunit RPC12/RpoP
MKLSRQDLEFLAELNGHNNQPETEKITCPDCGSLRVIKISNHSLARPGIYNITYECLDCGTTIIEK